MSGKLIVFEGPDGSGKTTQIKLLGEKITQEGCEVVYTREPGGTSISEKIRNILLDPQNKALADKTEVLLYAAARAQHVEELIKPQLSKGKIVLCDRFVDSTLAYQGFGRNIDLGFLKQVNHMATGGLVPDLVVIIDIDPEIGLKRIIENRPHKGLQAIDRIEQEKIDFHQRVRQGYLKLASVDSSRYIVVDGRKNIEDISADIYSVIESKFNF